MVTLEKAFIWIRKGRHLPDNTIRQFKDNPDIIIGSIRGKNKNVLKFISVEMIWNPDVLYALYLSFWHNNCICEILKLYPELESDRFLEYCMKGIYERNVEKGILYLFRFNIHTISLIYNSTKITYRYLFDDHAFMLLICCNYNASEFINRKISDKQFMMDLCEMSRNDFIYVDILQLYSDRYGPYDEFDEKLKNNDLLIDKVNESIKSHGLTELEALRKVLQMRNDSRQKSARFIV